MIGMVVVMGMVVVFVAVSLIWGQVSDDRLTAANHRQADQRITAMTASFMRQLDRQGQRSALTDADLWTAARDTQSGRFAGGSGVLEQGLQVFEPVTRGKGLTFYITVMTVYRVPGWFTSGDHEDERCFKVQIRSAGLSPAQARSRRCRTACRSNRSRC